MDIVIETATGKLVLSQPIREFWPESLARSGFEALNVSIDHVFSVSGLRLHHRDPFDRILVAQAVAERLQIVSADPAFDAYPVVRIW
jgi:PIN domain nuclease of toxin-antitoxin system